MSISFKEVNFAYNAKSKFSRLALENINFSLELGKVYFIIGHTGSGKSTIAQLINGLLLPTSGQITVKTKEREFILGSKVKKKIFKPLRKTAGLVFQFPEYQLFEESVIKDVMFGPLNFGFSKVEAEIKAKEALKTVEIDESLYEKSPFLLSGGQKRRVAIAGILSFSPDILILDEPTAGLDPKNARKMLELFINLNKELGKTVIIISHQLDDCLEFADNVILMSDKKIVAIDNPISLLYNKETMAKANLELSPLVTLVYQLIERGVNLDINKIKTTSDLVKELT